MVRVGQRLREERIKKGLTIEAVSKEIRIRAAFLSAIERGEYQKLPSSAYIHGFIKNYADFLDLPKREILAMFRREFDEERFIKVLPDGLTRKEDFPVHKIRLQQTVITIFLVFLALISYISFQYRYAIINPPIEIYFPKENDIISSQTAVVSGKTDSNASLYVNNVSVTLDQNGNFKKNVDLFLGKAVIRIKAVNRFGRQTEIERHVEVLTSNPN